MIDKLILGTVQLGLDYGINNSVGKPSLSQSFEILNNAYDSNLRILDTAEAYGNSQDVIGDFHRKYPNKRFKIITKLAAVHNLSAKDFIPNIKKNCDTLAVEKLYGFMFHNYDSFIKNKEFYQEILKAKEDGLMRYAGISLYTNDEIEDIVTNYSDFDFIQIPFNLFDNESKRKEAIEKARGKNIEIHTRSVFLQGLFFKSPSGLTLKMSPLKPYLRELETIKKEYNISTEELALQYVLQKKYIDHVLIGVENVGQLKNNLTTCSKKSTIPHSVLNKIDILEVNLLNPSNWN